MNKLTGFNQMTAGLLLSAGLCLGTVTTALVSQEVQAFTFQMMQDSDLLDQSPVVITGRVLSLRPVTDDGGTVMATRYTVLVTDRIKGKTKAAVYVEIPGTGLPADKQMVVYGAPHYTRNDEVMFFLSPVKGNLYRLQQFALGAFDIKTVDGSAYAVRLIDGIDVSDPAHAHATRFSDAVAARKRSKEAYREPSAVRHLEAFKDALKAQAGQKAKARVQASGSGSYFVTDTAKAAPVLAQKKSSVTTAARQPKARMWRSYKTDSSRDPNGGTWQFRYNGGEQYLASMQEAAETWNAVPGVTVQMGIEGPTTETSYADGYGSTCHALTGSLIQFEDPTGVIPGSFQCGSGGTLAVAGVCSDRTTHEYYGHTYGTATRGVITVQNGVDCVWAGNPAEVTEVMIHEMGHTLGLGHDADIDTVMYPRARSRGAWLHCSDQEAVSVIYGSGETWCGFDMPDTSPFPD